MPPGCVPLAGPSAERGAAPALQFPGPGSGTQRVAKASSFPPSGKQPAWRAWALSLLPPGLWLPWGHIGYFSKETCHENSPRPDLRLGPREQTSLRRGQPPLPFLVAGSLSLTELRVVPLCLPGPPPTQDPPPAPAGEQHAVYGNGEDLQQGHARWVPEGRGGPLEGTRTRKPCEPQASGVSHWGRK